MAIKIVERRGVTSRRGRGSRRYNRLQESINVRSVEKSIRELASVLGASGYSATIEDSRVVGVEIGDIVFTEVVDVDIRSGLIEIRQVVAPDPDLGGRAYKRDASVTAGELGRYLMSEREVMDQVTAAAESQYDFIVKNPKNFGGGSDMMLQGRNKSQYVRDIVDDVKTRIRNLK